MTNQIEPYSMIQKTNIKEHNDMVNKINEIVDVINNVNLDTINAEISGLKAKATATDTEIANIKNKDTQQDTEIDGIDKSLISNVTATFDNPSRELKISVGKKDSTSIDATVVIPSSSETGQYSAGNGITIENYQIAVDTNVVALKTDIPVVPDVSGINNRLDTIDGEITGINANITNLTNKNTEQDTAINGKVAIAQGVENSGKVLGIGADGNVTPVDTGGSSGGGEVWEEIDFNNFPTDLKSDEKLKVQFSIGITKATPTSWTNAFVDLPNIFGNTNTFKNAEIVCRVGNDNSNSYCGATINNSVSENIISIAYLETVSKYSSINSSNTATIFTIVVIAFNGANAKLRSVPITKENIETYVYKLYRLKSST